ncbi:TPA: plasmid recombination protein [Klebsiella pneumoniae]|jgi:hypothetical protein|uniref:MobV family relaxase n=1 Tax=Haemophilus influenzae TaxID=727 RepID=UPI000D01CDFB|nr:MobV family relaxase [Haemophilus influenzae]PRM16483.1 Plasmid recombination enzyme [Haemophilus influenzae]HBT4927190.1 plasmid recombination protein [Klebsiella pneumoniae]
MSKLVCNFDKYKGSQLYGMDIHIQRKTDNHSNKDIDLSRKHLNYELVAEHQNEHYYTRAKNRIEQGYTGKRKIRKDGVWTGNVIISSDQEFFKKLTPEQEREFFKTAYDFYCEKYGKENVISAMVHKDETTPHLHLLIVPLTKDGRLCAKELFDREALRSFHDIIAKRLQQRGFNIERGERNAKVKRMETDEYKRLKKDNQVTVKINPNDTVATVLEKKLIGADVKETPEQIANRLTQKYVKPLTDELTDLKTEKALAEKRNDAIKHAKAFSQSRENEFIALYHSLKEFGEKHVSTALEKIQNLVSKLNTEKQKEREQRALEREKELKEKQRNNQFAQYREPDSLCSVLDFGKAPYQFEDNGKPSYYIAVQAQNGQPKVLWGTEYQEQIQGLNIRIGDIVRLNGSKIERAEEINHKASKGVKI